jgi:hypothetical protein
MKEWLRAKWRHKSWRWIFIGVGTVILRLVLGLFPGFVETVYSRGIFLGIRFVLDHSFGLLPFPATYLVLPILLVMLWLRIRKWPKLPSFKAKIGRLVLGLFALAGGFLFFFNLLWGFNYDRIPLEDHLGLKLDSLDLEQLCMEADWVARRAEFARAKIPNISDDSISLDMVPANLEQEVRHSLGRVLTIMDYPVLNQARPRMIPGGWMLRIGISGIYNPFTGEGNVTAAQTPQRWPFTMAHELSHAAGFGNEGVCNFIGMLACEQSDLGFVVYSGRMGYWSHLAAEIFERDPLLYQMLKHNLDPGIQADLRANYNNAMKYRGAISKLGQQVNNAYLRVQGVDGGIKSYDQVVMLRAAWHKREGW